MARKRKKRQPSKYEKDAVLVSATVNKIDFINLEVNGKLKTVFYCPSYICPEGRMCIAWGRTNIQIGDEIQMKGRFVDDVFLVWSLMISKRKEQQAEKEAS